MITNNVTRFLDSKKIAYTAFELPSEKAGAARTAEILKVPLHQIFKTIVLRRDKPGKAILAVVPGDQTVDLKRVAQALNEKKVYLTTQNEAEQLTGLLAGGISPLALMNKGFQVVLDESAMEFDEIHISGGQRGLNLRLKVSDLILLTQASVCSITA